MNNQFMLQNFIQNGNGMQASEPQPKKKSTKMNAHELEMHIGTVFNQVCRMLQESDASIALPEEVSKASEKISLFKEIVSELLQGGRKGGEAVNESNAIICADCQNYENSLQKLEQQVRQHIRLEQQLKLFQDTQQEKLQQQKKQKKQFQRKIQNLRKQLQESKGNGAVATEKLAKLQGQNEQLRKDLRQAKRSGSIHQQGMSTKRQSHKQSAFAYESKENKIDWVHRNVSVKKERVEKEEKGDKERRSIERRGESGEKNWRMSSNARSSKMISVMNDKLVQQKTKEERRKVIQSKFDYRR